MAQIETIDTVLERCRFISSERELDRTNKHVRSALPPLSTVAVRGGARRRSFQAYPVVPSPRLVELLTHFLADEIRYTDERGPRSAPFTQQDLEQFRDEPYFAELASLVAKTRAHGTVLRLDSVLWIHLSWLISTLLHPDEAFLQWLRELCPGVRDEALQILHGLDGGGQAGRTRAAELRRAALRSLITRNEYANRTVSRMVGDDKPNALHTAMAANQLVFTLPTGFPTSFDLQALVAAKDYGFTASRLTDLVRALRAVVEDLYRHREDQALSGTERFFYSQFFRTAVMEHVRHLDPARLPGGADETFDDPDAALTFKLGWTLVFHDDVLRYLLTHLDQLNTKRALPPRLRGQLSKEVLEVFERPELLRKREDKVLELARDLRLLDLFDTLRDFQALVAGDQGSFTLDGQPLQSSSIPLDLGSYYEVYHRNRSGVAVFIDLIGFTRKTRELFFGGGSTSTTEDVEIRDRGELAALALERVFHVREELRAFGGDAEGFEGDAILDLFPDPLSALRYVARFAENYRHYARIQFRPFSRPVPNPFATEGFRVGIASGEYTLVNVPDMDASGTLHARLRAIGPAINKASRLNSGKKDTGELFLSAGPEQAGEEVADPLGVLRVEVDHHQLANGGLCLDRNTFNELRSLVRRAALPHWLPHGQAGFELEGRDVEPKAYCFALIVHDPAGGHVFALRRLPQIPKLKGLGESESVVYEALLFSEEEYLEFLRRDGELPAAEWAAPRRSEDSVERRREPEPGSEDQGDLSQSLPDYLYRRPSGGHDSISELSGDASHSSGSGDSLVALAEEDGPAPAEDEGSASDLDVFASLELQDVFGDGDSLDVPSRDEESRSLAPPPEDSAELGQGMLGDELLDRASDLFDELEEELSSSGAASGGDRPPGHEQHDLLERTGDGLELDDPDEPSVIVRELAEGAISLGDSDEDEDEDSFDPDAVSDLAARLFAEEASLGEDESVDEEEDAVVFSIEVPGDTTGDLDGPGAAAPSAPVPAAPPDPTPPWLADAEPAAPPPPAAPASTPAPSPAVAAAPPADARPSLLGALDGRVVDRISSVLGRPYPHGGGSRRWDGTERSVDVPDGPERGERARVPTPELEVALAGYHMVVRMLEHESEVWIGRLAEQVLFDLHRYRMPTPPHGGIDLSGVLEQFLRDKVREDFLAFGTRYAALPPDGSPPVALPTDEATHVLATIAEL